MTSASRECVTFIQHITDRGVVIDRYARPRLARKGQQLGKMLVMRLSGLMKQAQVLTEGIVNHRPDRAAVSGRNIARLHI